MYKNFFLSIPFTFISFLPVLAQQGRDFGGPIGYIEVGGNSGPTVSINGEILIFSKSKFHINWHGGYGISRVHDNPAYAIPVGLRAFHGARNSHIEVGLGLTYVKCYRVYYVGNETVLSNALYFAPNIAYRFQKPTGGFFSELLIRRYFGWKSTGSLNTGFRIQ